MPTAQDINDQQAQLHQARLALQQLLQQTQQRNPSVAPLAVVQQLVQTQADIARAKTLLRGWGVAVADLPDDALSARDLFGEVLRLDVTDQRKGLFADGATFHGDVIGYQENTTIHLPPPAPPMPLEQALGMLAELPLDHVPPPQPLPNPHRMDLRPNPLFVGRVDELHQIAAQLKAGATVLVTAGIGGVGKTQLAVEVAHRYGRYFGGGVFWLSFADPGTIAGEVAACGRSMGAFHDAEKLEQAVQVQRTLARWANGPPCLLIFDNCEDEALLREWQPKTGQSRVLVTTRHQGQWSPELDVQLLALDVLAREESIALLRRLAPRLADHEADLIAKELGDLPLALHLAGRYLALYRSVTAAEYLANLRSPDLLAHRSLTGHQVKHMPTEREPHVARVFALSFDRLDQDDPIDVLARQLLARAACFAPGEPFAQNWLEATVEVAGDTEARTDATNRLLALGLLEQDGDWLRLHRLLAAYAQQALPDDAALSTVEQVVNGVAARANKMGVPQAMLPVLPHLRHLVQRADGYEDEMTAALCNELGCYLQAVGAYDDALPLYERALAIFERVLGCDHPDTATSLNNLGKLHYAQGAYERALPLVERALAISERVLGSDHPDTATSLNNLAALYFAQGVYEPALTLYERALAIKERVLGSDHSNTASSLNNLALLHYAQGAYERALPLLERALAIKERVLGSDHPDTAISLYNLAMFHAEQGAFNIALPILEQALHIHHTRLGPQHPDSIEVQQSLVAMRQAAAIAALPEAVRAAVQAQDGPAFHQAFQALSPEQVQAVVVQFLAIVMQADPLEEFAPLLQAIAAVAQGNAGPRAQVKAALARLEQHGFHLTAAIGALWGGQRDPAALTAGLDDTDAALIRRVLALLQRSTS
ncbi:MAG: hypothetical protein OHK0022_18910 [Roseiflexaceae bacterium]